MLTPPNDAAGQPFPALPAGLPNASSPLPGLITAGQPSAAHLEELAQAGVAVVVDLRAPSEPRGFDEQGVAERLGLEYHNIPVGATIGATEIDAIRAIVRAKANRPVLVHCKSANRVGGALIPFLILDEQQPRDAVVETARRIGLRGEELARSALAYVDAAEATL